MNGKNIGQNSVTRGSLIALGIALSFLELPTFAAIVTGLSVYQSIKAGSNPGKDCLDVAKDIVNGFNNFVSEEKSILDFPLQTLKNVSVDSFITVKKSGKTLDTDWILEIAGKTNVGLLGDQGEGKSFLLRFFLYQFLNFHDFDLGKCRVYIHDIENGLGHGEQSSWLGLNNNYVYSDPSDFIRILEEIEKSIELPDFKPTLLIVDEFNNLMDEYSKVEKDKIDGILKQIRNRGKKRKIHLVFSTQDANVTDLGLNQSVVRKLDWIVYPKMANSKENFRNFGLSTESENRRANLASELKSVDKVGGIFPVLLYRNKEFSLVRIPDLTNMPDSLPVADIITPDTWWEQLRANNPQLDPDKYTSLRKLVDAVNDILRVNNLPIINRKLTDERYLHLRALMGGSEPRNNVAPRVTDDGESHAPSPKCQISPLDNLPIPCDFAVTDEFINLVKN